jgi:CcmD family protein
LLAHTSTFNQPGVILMSPEMQNIVSFLIPAYGVFWLFTFLYVFSVRSRQKNLEKDIETLRLLAEKKKETGSK